MSLTENHMKKQLIAIGQDDGHDTVKTCSGYDAAAGRYRYGYHKSKASAGIHQVMSVGSDHTSAYETEGSQYTVANGQALIRTMDTRIVNYPVSDLNRVLVNHALSDVGLGGQDVYLVTGLPVDQYYKDSAPNTELIDRKMDSLSKPVTRIGTGAPMAKIVRQKVVSEAIAAFYDALLNHDGTLNASIQQIIARRPVAVIDLGGKTLDIAVVIENVRGVYGERSGTQDTGVLALITKVTARIKSQFNLSNDPPPNYVEEALRTKKYELFGVEHDVSSIVERACTEYLAEVKNFFVSKVGDGSDLGAVIFVGGGAALIRSALGDEAFRQVFQGKCLIADDPEFANARGMWKFANFIVRAEDRVVDVPDAVAIQEVPAAKSKKLAAA